MEDNRSLFSLSIDPVTKAHLSDTARWARFLAIFGMVLLALAALASIFGLTLVNRLSNIDATLDPSGIAATSRIAAILGAIVMIAIAFFPLMYLLQFANKMKKALAANDQEALNDSFLNIKRYFRYLGIIAIIVLAFYALFFVIAIVGIASSR